MSSTLKITHIHLTSVPLLTCSIYLVWKKKKKENKKLKKPFYYAQRWSTEIQEIKIPMTEYNDKGIWLLKKKWEW